MYSQFVLKNVNTFLMVLVVLFQKLWGYLKLSNTQLKEIVFLSDLNQTNNKKTNLNHCQYTTTGYYLCPKNGMSKFFTKYSIQNPTHEFP